MKIIGLTGGIGSGKSTVAQFLAELGAVVIDLDRIGHEAIKSGDPAWQQVVDTFGEKILTPDGEIDRTRLGEIVFNDREALIRLNRIIHPVIDSIVAGKIDAYRHQGVKVVVLEAAAMLESRKTGQVEELWITIAPEVMVLDRLKARSRYSPKEAKTRMRSQLSNEERIKEADVVIDTDCTLGELKNRVMVEWQRLLERMSNAE